MKYLGESQAGAQLEWVLDALDGTAVTEDVVAARFGDSFKSLFPPTRWIEMMGQQSPRLRPFTATAVEVRTDRARADLDTPIGPMVVSCIIDAEGRIEMLALAPAGGAGLTPRLPMEFEPGGATSSGGGQRLVVVAGVPGTGKSTLADQLGVHLAAPVFAIDWLLGALTPFGGRGFDRLLDLGEELLTTLAYRQLALGQSAIVDTPCEKEATRVRWASLAGHFGASFVAVVCSCSDDATHQGRLTSRSRGIPGWHEGGDWNQVRQRRDNFPPWIGEHLEVDAMRPVDENVEHALAWIRRR